MDTRFITAHIIDFYGFEPHPDTDPNERDMSKIIGGCSYEVIYSDGTFEVLYTGLRPGNNGGWSEKVIVAAQDWLDAGGVIPEYVPPTQDELRSLFPTLTARQFRLGMLYAGIALSQVDDYIANIQDPMQKEYAEVEWRYAGEFERLHPLVVELSAHFLITPAELDTLWEHVRTM